MLCVYKCLVRYWCESQSACLFAYLLMRHYVILDGENKTKHNLDIVACNRQLSFCFYLILGNYLSFEL